MLKSVFLRLSLLSIFLLVLVSPPNAITTSISANDHSWNFVAYGDTRSNHTAHQQVVDRFLQYDPEFVINTGDLVHHGGDDDAWAEYLRITENITGPIYPCIGNHETDGDPDWANYIKYTGCETYYSFDWKGIHCVSVNTEENWIEQNGSFTPTKEQWNWLIKDLSKNADRTLIVFFHRPMFSPNPGRAVHADAVRVLLLDTFIQYDVDLVFNGHDHYYYRTYRNGTYYVVTGGGGAPLYYPRDPDGTLMLSDDVAFRAHHFCNIAVNDSHLTATGIMANGTLGDSFTMALEGSSISYRASEDSSGFELGFFLAIVGLVVFRKIAPKRNQRPKC
ncbi:MAG: metallophosphoesterase family protein [Candidatus Thorarchaeota archaeon]